jgi:hypothetical protein
VSTLPAQERDRDRLDTIGGLLSATAIFVGLLGMTNLNLSISGTHLEMRPIRIGVAAIALALIASAIGGRHSRLATVAVGVAGCSWVAGMIIAVVTQRPIF